MSESKFNFFIPLGGEEIEKAAKKEKTDESRYDNMILEGLASDNSTDLDGEILEPQGFITDVFLKSGLINYEHLGKKDSKFYIGEPIEAKVVGNNFNIKAKLFKKSELARNLWDKLIEIKESGSNRTGGWSIEGKPLAKDPNNPKRITRALITHTAFTFQPTNQNSFADIVKGQQKDDYIEPEYEKSESNEGSIYTFEKDGKKYIVTKDFKVQEVVEKAMTVENTKCMAPESLNEKVKTVAELSKSISTVAKYSGLFDNDFSDRIKKNIENIFLYQ